MSHATEKRLERTLAWAVTLLLASIWAADAHAQRAPMTREQIIQLITPAIGHGYQWGGSTWTADGSRKGACILREESPDGCPACDFPAGAVGADCAGFVAKAWQLSRPSAVDEPFRPYSAGSFFTNTTEWVRIGFNELKPGDGLARRSHTVLFDSVLGPNKVMTWEAKGCQWNIVHEDRTVNFTSGEWVAIRRLDLIEPEECQPSTCNSHGACSEGRCSCDAGYAGDRCERCAAGFLGFPACVAAAQSCTPQGTLACEQSFTVSPALGKNELQGYSCDPADRSGNEVVYQFAPEGTGSVTVSSSAGTLLGLRGACSPEACIASSGSQLQFDYGGGEPFFIVVESSGGSEASLSIDCQTSDPRWIGDACNDDSDCVLTRASGEVINGTCYRSSVSGGFCTTACTRGCPDLPPNKASTFCVEDPAAAGAGMCVSKSERANKFCEGVPGTVAKSSGRFQDEANTANVCFPSATPAPCEGSIAGTIASSLGGAPIPGAVVEVRGAMTLGFTTDAGGAYSGEKLACGVYTLAVSAAGFLDELITATVTASGTSHVTRLNALPEGECVGDAPLQGSVFDGVSPTSTPLSGALVELRRGIDTEQGDIVADALSVADGSFEFPSLPSGNYTALVSADGYARALTNLVVCGGLPLEPKAIALTPRQDGVMRVVLEWDRPNDLDLHLQLPNGDEIFFDGPCRGSLSGVQHAALDIDRLTPSGPETISIDRFSPGLYTVFVHDFSGQNEAAPEGFAQSNARVVVLGEGDVELARFAVPSGGGGPFWDVFQFQGADPGALISVQELNGSRANPYDEYTGACRP